MFFRLISLKIFTLVMKLLSYEIMKFMKFTKFYEIIKLIFEIKVYNTDLSIKLIDLEVDIVAEFYTKFIFCVEMRIQYSVNLGKSFLRIY